MREYTDKLASQDGGHWVTTPPAKASGLSIGFSRPAGKHHSATIRTATGTTLRYCPLRACSPAQLPRGAAFVDTNVAASQNGILSVDGIGGGSRSHGHHSVRRDDPEPRELRRTTQQAQPTPRGLDLFGR